MRLFVLCAVLLLSACVSAEAPAPAPRQSPQAMMTAVAKRVQACWFKTNDKRVRNLALSPELNSYAGRPRILLVPRARQDALPVLVAQAERINGRTTFSSFGPLVGKAGGQDLQNDLNRWASGEKSC